MAQPSIVAHVFLSVCLYVRMYVRVCVYISSQDYKSLGIYIENRAIRMMLARIER